MSLSMEARKEAGALYARQRIEELGANGQVLEEVIAEAFTAGVSAFSTSIEEVREAFRVLKCAQCGGVLPADRAGRGATTCSDKCRKDRSRIGIGKFMKRTPFSYTPNEVARRHP